MQTHCTCVVFVCIMRTASRRPSSSSSRPCAWLRTTTRLGSHAEWVIHETLRNEILQQTIWGIPIDTTITLLLFSLGAFLHFTFDVTLMVLRVLSFQDAKALKAKKEEGNTAFKEGNYDAAYELYSEALTIDPNNIKTNAKLYCNRATVGSKVRTPTSDNCKVNLRVFFRCLLKATEG